MGKFSKSLIIFLATITGLAVILFCYFFIGKSPVSENITWGVDFSQSQAEYLKLNWKQVYSAIINDLEAKNIKLHTNWNWIEEKQDNYYFDDIDWQINKAERGLGGVPVKIIYVLGLKTGRWPECHLPSWASNMSEQRQKSELLDYITQVVKRYRNSKSIVYCQIENEPLFKFGQCPSWYYNDSDFLKQEIALIKSLDPSRKVIVSDSGEDSLWLGAAEAGDIVGITMYRQAWAHITNTFGFNLNYFFYPVYYYRKALIIDKLFGKDVFCIELQAEPWTQKPIMDSSLKDQLKSMNAKIFQKNISFAKQTGLDKFYLWGVEWWYWLKETQNQPAIWNEAKSLFN